MPSRIYPDGMIPKIFKKQSEHRNSPGFVGSGQLPFPLPSTLLQSPEQGGLRTRLSLARVRPPPPPPPPPPPRSIAAADSITSSSEPSEVLSSRSSTHSASSCRSAPPKPLIISPARCVELLTTWRPPS